MHLLHCHAVSDLSLRLISQALIIATDRRLCKIIASHLLPMKGPRSSGERMTVRGRCERLVEPRSAAYDRFGTSASTAEA